MSFLRNLKILALFAIDILFLRNLEINDCFDIDMSFLLLLIFCSYGTKEFKVDFDLRMGKDSTNSGSEDIFKLFSFCMNFFNNEMLYLLKFYSS